MVVWLAGTLPGGYLRPGLRMPDSQLPMPDFFFSGACVFGVPRGFPFPVCPGRVSDFRIFGHPVSVPCLRPLRFACPVFACPGYGCGGVPGVPRRPCPAAVARPGSACRRFVALAVSDRREPVPAACACPASVRPDFVRAVFVRLAFPPLASALRFVLYPVFSRLAFSGCFVREPVPRNPGRVPVRSV